MRSDPPAATLACDLATCSEQATLPVANSQLQLPDVRLIRGQAQDLTLQLIQPIQPTNGPVLQSGEPPSRVAAFEPSARSTVAS